MKNFKAIVSIAIVTMLIASTFLMSANALQGARDELKVDNQVLIRGSSTVYPISAEAKLAYETAHSGITINLPDAEGSGTGLDALTQKSTAEIGADVAAASKIPDYKTLPDKNYWTDIPANDFGMADLRIWPIGKDSVAIIVDKENPYYSKISQLTIQQIALAFTSDTTNGPSHYPTWKSLVQAIGGDTTGMGDEAIELVMRPLNSGTHDGFNNMFLTPGGSTTIAAHTEKTENQQVVDYVKDHPYALAYVGLGFLEDNPTLLNGIAVGYDGVNYVTPTLAHVLDNSYCYAEGKPIYRWLWYATNGIPTKGSDGALKTSFINWVKMHPEYVDHAGYVRMLKADFCGATPLFASSDTAPTHPSLPDDKCSSADITYFLLAYNAQYDSRPTINPLTDYNMDNQITSADITQFLIGYNSYFTGGGF
ncbi:MAG: PstS family phosphate ABC transporter substrate-binding protein [Candidatus Bathyarchaeia archaeon]|jgi:ABC-type phosphate transport system substrate-binding protein